MWTGKAAFNGGMATYDRHGPLARYRRKTVGFPRRGRYRERKQAKESRALDSGAGAEVIEFERRAGRMRD